MSSALGPERDPGRQVRAAFSRVELVGLPVSPGLFGPATRRLREFVLEDRDT